MAWLLDGFPEPGAAILSGDVVLGNDGWPGVMELTVSVDQGGWTKASRSFLVRSRGKNRYGVSFVNDGSPYWITFSVRLLTAECFEGASCGVLPLECVSPLAHCADPQCYSLPADGVGALVSVNQGGLMNRMVCALSCLHLAEELGRSALVWWGRNQHCAASFDDLFERPRVDPSTFAHEYTRYFNDGQSAQFAAATPESSVLIDSVGPLVWAQPYGFAQIGQAFSQLTLSRDVRELLSLYKDLDLTSAVGLHIRKPFTSGAFAELERSKFRIDSDTFGEIVESIKRDRPYVSRVLLCTNDADEADRMVEAYGEFIFVPPKTSLDNSHSPQAVREALVDCLLLSRCPILVSQITTMFGMMAHAISGNRYFALLEGSHCNAMRFLEYSRGEQAGVREWRREGELPLAEAIFGVPLSRAMGAQSI